MATQPLILDIADEEDTLGAPGAGREAGPVGRETRGPVGTSLGRAVRGESLDPAEVARDVALGVVPGGMLASSLLGLADMFGLQGTVGGPLGSPDAPDISNPDVQRALEEDAARRGVAPATDQRGMAGMEAAARDQGIGPATGTDPGLGVEGSRSPSDKEGGNSGGGGGGIGSSDAGGSAAAGEGTGEGGARAKGGMITRDIAQNPKDPPGPDDIYITAQVGEFMMTREATKAIGPDLLGEINRLAKDGITEREAGRLLYKLGRKLMPLVAKPKSKAASAPRGA